MKPILERLAQGDILVADGAMGTYLQSRGLAVGECPEAWCLSRPEIVRGAGEAYAAAGAEIIETNSFGGSSLKLAAHGLSDKTREINRVAAKLARQAIGANGYVAASVGPTGQFPEEEHGDIPGERLYEIFAEQMSALAEGGADAICIETMISLGEAAAAVRAAKENTKLPVLCTFTFSARPGGFFTMMGATPEQAARTAVVAGADVVGANCGNGIAEMIEICRQMRATAPGTPILIQANAGLPALENGKTVYPEDPQLMASKVPQLLEAGVNVVGGCCGTTPAHISALAEALHAVPERQRHG